jgi:Membrane bound FAD containing D-sorbitol dehydrogenase
MNPSNAFLMFENPRVIGLSGEQRVTRRKLLAGTAVNVFVLGAPFKSVEARGLDLSTFLQLSTKLTGHQNLPAETGRRYLQNILAGGSYKHLKKSPGLQKEEQTPIESRIVADWYSGQTIAPQGTICIDYTGALLWDAIGFARPRGIPDTEAWRWALAPSQ